jgi:hypothetical protein
MPHLGSRPQGAACSPPCAPAAPDSLPHRRLANALRRSECHLLPARRVELKFHRCSTVDLLCREQRATDVETGKLVIISLWETREQMDAVTAGAGPSGIREQHNPATAGLTAQHLETYEVTMHA